MKDGLVKYKVIKTGNIHYRYREEGELIELPQNIALKYVFEGIIESEDVTEVSKENVAPSKKGDKK